jgi:hypothetical protein
MSGALGVCHSHRSGEERAFVRHQACSLPQPGIPPPERFKQGRLGWPQLSRRYRAHTAKGHQRRRPESNRCTRLCRPLRNHSATSPRRSQAYRVGEPSRRRRGFAFGAHSADTLAPKGRLAQLGERRLDKAEVAGSSPASPITGECSRTPAAAGVLCPRDRMSRRTRFAAPTGTRADWRRWAHHPAKRVASALVRCASGRRQGRRS